MGFCLVHMLHIAAGELVSLSGSRGASLSYVSSLYSTSKLFKTPGYFLRVLDNLWDVVDHYLIIKTAARPCFTCFFVVVVRSAITNSSSSLVYSYCMVMFGCIKEAPPQGAREHNAAVLRSVCAGEALYEALLVLLTDWWWGPNLVHHCHGCCRDRRDTVRKIVDVLSLTIFNQTPPTPIPSRWSKVTVTVIWFYKGFAVHNILSKVFDWCFNPHGQRTVRGGLVVSEQALGSNVISHSGMLASLFPGVGIGDVNSNASCNRVSR